MPASEKMQPQKQFLFVPIQEMLGIIGASGANTSAGTGTPAIAELGTTGLTGLLVNADDEEICHTMRFPSDWDRHHQVKVRVIWTTESTTNLDSLTWTFLYNELTPGVADALITPATVLDTAITIDVVATGDTATALRRTAAGVIDSKSIADAALYWSFLVKVTEGVGNPLTDGVTLLGVEFEYTPKQSWLPNYAEAKEWRA